ncbi:MAG TPA: hypothetical protein VFF31_24915 [Blastocatellia bacterium]|nr:hypothetical protein [Blastocatellia bacterium]
MLCFVSWTPWTGQDEKVSGYSAAHIGQYSTTPPAGSSSVREELTEALREGLSESVREGLTVLLAVLLSAGRKASDEPSSGQKK